MNNPLLSSMALMLLTEALKTPKAVADALAELRGARRTHPQDFNSAHEGFAVLKEEVDELWDEVRTKDRDFQQMRKEAIQVAAMAIRFVEEVCDKRRPATKPKAAPAGTFFNPPLPPLIFELVDAQIKGLLPAKGETFGAQIRGW